MKGDITAIDIHPATFRAGVISLLVLAICFIAMTGLSDLPRTLAFIGMFGVCLMLMMKSVVDLLVWLFGFTATYCGMGLGRSVGWLRRFSGKWKH